MDANTKRIIARLQAVKPIDDLLPVQAFVARLQSGDVRFDLPGLPERLADIQRMRNTLWEIHQQNIGIQDKLSILRELPPVPMTFVPDNF